MPEEAAEIYAPAGFVPANGVAFGTIGGAATAVDSAHPLPVVETVVASGITPLAGSTSTSTVVGPYAPQLERAIQLSLAGTWTGSAQLLRSVDGGTTKSPLTLGGQAWASFTANCNEPVAEESEAAATYYLAITLSAGTLTYRVAQ